MLSFGKLWSFGLLVVTFVFLPSENWNYWFVGNKGESYAEFCFRGDQHCYVVGKNLLSKPVKLGFNGVQGGWVQRFRSSQISGLDKDNIVPPESYSLVELDAKGYLGSIPHTLDNEQIVPKELILVAPAEEQKWFFLVFALLLGAAALTYSILSYIREDNRQKADKNTNYSWNFQR